MENGGLENSIEEDIEKKISWKKRINLRNEKNQNKDDKIKEVSSTVQSIRYLSLKIFNRIFTKHHVHFSTQVNLFSDWNSKIMYPIWKTSFVPKLEKWKTKSKQKSKISRVN